MLKTVISVKSQIFHKIDNFAYSVSMCIKVDYNNKVTVIDNNYKKY